MRLESRHITVMDLNTNAGSQVEAVRRCTDTKPISAEEARKMLALFPLVGASRSAVEVQVLIARVSLDQSVRLEESIDKLEQKSTRLSQQLVYLTGVLVVLTLALVGLAWVTYWGDARARELNAALAAKQDTEKHATDCAEQARHAGQDMGKSLGAFGVRETITGVSNHYNHKLGKCIVDVQTVDKNGTGEYVMDAYEQSSILWCLNRLSPKIQRVCMDAKSNAIDPVDADKQIDALLRE